MVDVVEYCDRPVRKKDGGLLNPNNIPCTHHNDSDDSDEEDVVPLGEFWHIPEDEWTVVVTVKLSRSFSSTGAGR